MTDRTPPTALDEVPAPVRWIVETLEERGFATWTVGGAVRDALTGRSGGDWDLATRARPEEVRRIFRRTVPLGIDHGTVGVLDREGRMYEVTTFRRDVETFGRHAVVEFADTIDEDLARRDFTVNALAWHPIRRELRDPFGGVQDLEEGRLRTVGDPADRFAEDHLRILRALRFAGRFGLRIEEETWRSLCSGVGRLHDLSAERVREELTKVLGGTEPPSAALGLYAASGALAEVAPELEATVGHARPPGAPGTVWDHALLTVDTLPPEPVLRLAALFREVGVPEDVPGHDDRELGTTERAAARTVAVMTRLRFSNARTDRTVRLVRATSDRPPDPSEGRARLRRWLSRHGPSVLRDVGRVWIASARVERRRGRPEAARCATTAWRALRRERREEPALAESDLALDGRDLIRMGLRPGPRFGRILAHLLDRVLDDPSLNEPAALEALVEEFLASESPDSEGVGDAAPRGEGAEGPERAAGREGEEGRA